MEHTPQGLPRRAPGLASSSPDDRSGPAHIAPLPPLSSSEVNLEPLDLVDTDEHGSVDAASKIKAFGTSDVVERRSQWARQTVANGTGACRVRSFHGRLSNQGLEFLDNSVNEWLDRHPGVEVKFVTSSVGTFEGKVREPALILNLWY